MKTFLFTFFLLSIQVFFHGQSINKKTKCLVTGEIKAINCQKIKLLKINEDIRSDGIEIIVKEGIFNHELDLKYPEGFSIVFIKEGRGIIPTDLLIFLDSGKNNVIIYKQKEIFKCKVYGNSLNNEFDNFKNRIDSLRKIHLDSLDYLAQTESQYTDSISTIFNKFMADSSSNTDLSIFYAKTKHLRAARRKFQDQKKVFQKKSDDDIAAWKFAYINQNPSIVSYYLFYKELIYRNDKIVQEQSQTASLKFSEKYPDHPYTKSIKLIINGRSNLTIGKKYIDFSAPDLNDNILKLSEVINGKVALIDLWARWCGSCIYKSRSMMPIFEKYKNLGFAVLGIISEQKDMKFAKEILEKEKYPWKVLVEFKNQNKVWEKYGIPGSAGIMLLVDSKGVILKINPTAEEVEEILKKIL